MLFQNLKASFRNFSVHVSLSIWALVQGYHERSEFLTTFRLWLLPTFGITFGHIFGVFTVQVRMVAYILAESENDSAI